MKTTIQALLFSAVVHAIAFFIIWAYPFVYDFLDYLVDKYQGYKVISATVIEITSDVDTPEDYSLFIQFVITFTVVAALFPFLKKLYRAVRLRSFD